MRLECVCGVWMYVCRKLYKQGQYAEAYNCGSEAMKIYSGHERANKFVAKIRDIVCKFASQCLFCQSVFSSFCTAVKPVKRYYCCCYDRLQFTFS